LKIIIKNNEFSFKKIKIPLSELYSILQQANECLEDDLEVAISKIKHFENGQHLWAMTWSPIRLDDLQGVGLYYFIIEVIGYLKLNQDKSSIILEGEFDGYFKKYLQKNFPDVILKKISSRSHIRNTIGYHLGPLKYIAKAILKKKSDKINGQVWMSSPLNIVKHRYKHLLERISLTKIFYAGRLDRTVNAENKGDVINFMGYLNFSDVFASFRKAIILNRAKKIIKPIKLVDYAIRNSRLQHLSATILKERSVANIIKSNKPERILFTTANTYPPARILARQAYLNQIPFIVVACRHMFSGARLEERLINADILKINDAHVADAYAVWDEYSKQTLISQGVKETTIYVTTPDPREVSKIKASQKFENSLLILFTHEENLNKKLVEDLVLLKKSKNIIIRQHPLKPLTASQFEKLSSNFNIISDITSKDYGNFEFINILAITINSTSIIEAVSHGCGAIWMPYLNARSLLFFEIMNQLGVMVENVQDLENLLNSSDTELQAVIANCQKVYKNKFKAIDQTSEFLEQMKLI
jgi:UDP-N-acetylglucosamine 2-epimerase